MNFDAPDLDRVFEPAQREIELTARWSPGFFTQVLQVRGKVLDLQALEALGNKLLAEQPVPVTIGDNHYGLRVRDRGLSIDKRWFDSPMLVDVELTGTLFAVPKGWGRT